MGIKKTVGTPQRTFWVMIKVIIVTVAGALVAFVYTFLPGITFSSSAPIAKILVRAGNPVQRIMAFD